MRVDSHPEVLARLRAIVGRRHVLADARRMRRYCRGYRYGGGPALAVVRPGSLVEQWRVLEACVGAGVIVIMQAANTGLTGGSTPDGDDYDRAVVIVSTARLKGIHLLRDGRQVLCKPGATLFELEAQLKAIGREPHSVIGSSCIGASVVGGVANNSGGALVKRGPAYTEMALYARVDAEGKVELVNGLGLSLGDDPEEILGRLDRGAFSDADVKDEPGKAGSDRGYERRVRDVDADTPARFNADPGRLFEASGSAGKVVIFALRMDTFPAETDPVVFYVGSNDPSELARLRRHILSAFRHLPISGEYMHRDAYDLAARYGKDVFLAIEHLGTQRLPLFFSLKSWFDVLAEGVAWLPRFLSDRILQALSEVLPHHLPPRLQAYRERFEHHLMLKVTQPDAPEMREHLRAIFPSTSGDAFECTPQEGRKAFLHRFAAAGAAIRYRAVRHDAVEDILALDVALPRNEDAWFERLPHDIEGQLLNKLYYGHFLCHVFHQDYIVARGVDLATLKQRMLRLLDARGAEYPAEHNVGHQYPAKPALLSHYRALDPCNCLNPGIGFSSKLAHWT